MYRLGNWFLEVWGDEVVGRGDCYENPRFSEGHFIHTSAVLEIKINEEENWMKLFTYSGSCYVLDFADIAEYGAEGARRAFQSKGISFDIEKCVNLRNQRVEKLMQHLSGVLNPGSLYVRMAGGWSVWEAYFKAAENMVVPIEICRHVSSFSCDSILVTDWRNRLCDWRIFPYGSGIEPYHWSDGLDTVSIENLGGDFTFKGSHKNILCKQGEITVMKHEEYVGEGLFSPDAVNGKCIFLMK